MSSLIGASNEYMGPVEFLLYRIRRLKGRKNQTEQHGRATDLVTSAINWHKNNHIPSLPYREFSNEADDSTEIFEDTVAEVPSDEDDIRAYEAWELSKFEDRATSNEIGQEELLDIQRLVAEVEMQVKLAKSKPEPISMLNSQPEPESVLVSDLQSKPLLSFVEIRRLTKTAQVTYEEAVELCKTLVDTMYHNNDVEQRKVCDINEARLIELMNDYTQAAENADVDFLRLFICDAQQSVLMRETVFVNLVLRNANPTDVKDMVIKSIIDQLDRQCRKGMAIAPRLS